ncbi:MAG TPA: 50S ribosomal protein L11 methyltransferase [Vicinamibacterales bacterium]|nr:50S ribosomal protein L11 methyltransferase [Vicinamibacterales bacterium]
MSYLDLLQFHAYCLTETGSRLNQFARAIAATVRDGDAVLDLGTGSGLLALLACRAGARRVYAVESSDAIRLGELLAAATEFQGRIEFIQSHSSQLVLPEPVDVVVADIHDTFGLQAGGLDSFIDIRNRLLRPGGTLIPRAIQLLVAPLEAATFYEREIDVWARSVQGIALSPIRPFAVSHVHAGRFTPDHLLSPPVHIATIDLAGLDTFHVGGTVTSTVTRGGLLHGICGCFVTTLAGDIRISNIPGDSGTTNFAQAFFPLESPVAVEAGDEISTAVESHDGHALRWRVEISHVGQPAHARFEHSTLSGLLLSPQSLRKHASDYRPNLTPRGSMERALLERFDGTRPASELRTWLRDRFHDQLPTEREAESFLKATIERCG